VTDHSTVATGWSRVASAADLAEGEARAVTVCGRALVLAKAGGDVYALDDRCSHADVALSEGDVETGPRGPAIECWLHGSRFDLRTGVPSGPPAVAPVTTHEVRVDGDDVLVSLHP
jgi:3-phenylpropionate/trans-cinnamate dioxygenase ferredoxin subunit